MRFKTLTFVPLFTFVSCGVKSSPEPPLSYQPAKVKNIQLSQKGENVYIIWKYPAVYKDGRKIKEFKQVILVNGKKTRLKIYQNGELYWSKLKTNGKKELCTQIKVVAGKSSSISNLKCIKPETPDKTTVQFQLKPQEKGIKIKINTKGKEFLIYRGENPNTIKPIPYDTTRKTIYIDKNVKPNHQYCYYITRKEGNIESSPSKIKCVKYVDVYPPKPPENVSYIVKNGKLYIFWDLPKEKDIAGVIIEKNRVKIIDIPIRSYYFIDTKFKKGDIYTIYSIDTSGNKSTPVYLKIE